MRPARLVMLMENNQQQSPLPAACFNLLNLLGYAAESETLRNQVETVLVDFMVKLPSDLAKWLGPDPEKGHDNEDNLRKQLRILRDPMFRRLNRLTSELAVRAKGIAVGEMPTRDKIGECVKSQLCLWTVRSEVDVVGGRERREPQPPPARRPSHAEYSEAASLLFAPEIPSSLRPRGRSVHWALHIARESLARSEEYLAAGQYGLARSALQAAGQVLHTCKGGQGLEDVRRRVDRRLQLIDHREKDRDRLKLHQACAEMAQTVERFCSLTALRQAQRESEALKRHLKHIGHVYQHGRPGPDHFVPVRYAGRNQDLPGPQRSDIDVFRAPKVGEPPLRSTSAACSIPDAGVQQSVWRR